MNPNDHPHGGGEGKASIGRVSPVTPWGKPALGLKTRKKKKVKDMTDEELRDHISRMQLEKQYLELKKQTAPQRSKGSKFVEQVLTKSGDNIATQFVTYVLGTGTNKAFASVFGDPAILNPKKGQKDK